MVAKIKVLVVDDSAFMRKVIKDLLESDPSIEVIGTARNGQDALDKIPQLQPHVITLDVEMPVLDGLDTLKEIVSTYHLPVIMLSSTTSLGAENTVIALERGAFDFITKPSGSISLDLHKVRDELIEKVKLAFQNSAKIKKQNSSLIKQVKPQKTVLPEKVLPIQQLHPTHPKSDQKVKNILLIGTSTGGPKALQNVLLRLPRLEHTATLVVQHMPPSFTSSLANRLHQLTPHDVVEAKDGELIKGGTVYIAPGGYHMALKGLHSNKLAIHLHQDAPRGGHRPSVDVLFESASFLTTYNLVSVVMTGMGKDGTEGLKKLTQQRKVYSIAEDESTCVVYGMPRSIVDNQLADAILPLDQIPVLLTRLLQD